MVLKYTQLSMSHVGPQNSHVAFRIKEKGLLFKLHCHYGVCHLSILINANVVVLNLRVKGPGKNVASGFGPYECKIIELVVLVGHDNGLS